MYGVVSFDIFLTLADLNSRVPVIWERILGKPVEPRESLRLAEGIRSHYFPNYHALYQPPFRTMDSVFRQGFYEFFRAEGIEADPERAADIFREEHDRSPLYPDAVEMLRRVANRYRVVLSSDADLPMVRDLLGRIPHEAAFISEALGTYKANSDNAFFGTVCRTLGVSPGEILHVGDGLPDINGAKAAGLGCYFVDRRGRGLPPEAKYAPDYTGRDLMGLAEILGV